MPDTDARHQSIMNHPLLEQRLFSYNGLMYVNIITNGTIDRQGFESFYEITLYNLGLPNKKKKINVSSSPCATTVQGD